MIPRDIQHAFADQEIRPTCGVRPKHDRQILITAHRGESDDVYHHSTIGESKIGEIINPLLAQTQYCHVLTDTSCSCSRTVNGSKSTVQCNRLLRIKFKSWTAHILLHHNHRRSSLIPQGIQSKTTEVENLCMVNIDTTEFSSDVIAPIQDTLRALRPLHQ